MSLFSSSLVSSRGGGTLNLFGSDTEGLAEFNKELGLDIFTKHADNALIVAADPKTALSSFRAAVKTKESGWLARYKGVKKEYDDLGYPAEDAHQRALAAAKQLADQDIKIVAQRFPYILDEGSLVSMKAGFQVPSAKKAELDK